VSSSGIKNGDGEALVNISVQFSKLNPTAALYAMFHGETVITDIVMHSTSDDEMDLSPSMCPSVCVPLPTRDCRNIGLAKY
jgi:hypothetical protein